MDTDDPEEILLRTLAVQERWSDEVRIRRQYACVERSEESGLYVPPIEACLGWEVPHCSIVIRNFAIDDEFRADNPYWMHDPPSDNTNMCP